MSASGREALPDVRERLGCPTVCLGIVGRPSRIAGSGCEDPPKCPGVFGRPSRMSGSDRVAYRMSGNCREALPDVREWL